MVLARRVSLVTAAAVAAVAVACNSITAAPLPSPDAGDASVADGGDAGADAVAPVDDAGGDATLDAAPGDAAPGDATAGDATPGDASDDGGPDAGDAAIDAAVTDAGDAGDAGDAPVDAGPPTFTNIYTSIIDPICNGCHAYPVGSNLNMGTQADAYTNLVNQPAAGVACGNTAPDGGSLYVRVDPGHVSTSLLYLKVSGPPPCGDRMPKDAPAPLTPAQIALIAAWIDAGAPND